MGGHIRRLLLVLQNGKANTWWNLHCNRVNILGLSLLFSEHGHFCAAFVNYGTVEFDPHHPNQLYTAQHVEAVYCHETGIKYVCDDTRHIRFINYHDDKYY